MEIEDTRPVVFDLVWPQMVVSDAQFFLDEESSSDEQERLSDLHHFGIRVLWGLTSAPDPGGSIWPGTHYRPVIPIIGCIPAGEA